MGSNNVWCVATCTTYNLPAYCFRWLPAVVYNELMSSILLIHIIIAVSSIVIASIVFFKPSIKRIGISYGFIVGTVASGTALLIATPSSILHTCLSGLFYITVVSIITIATHVRVRKLAHEEI